MVKSSASTTITKDSATEELAKLKEIQRAHQKKLAELIAETKAEGFVQTPEFLEKLQDLSSSADTFVGAKAEAKAIAAGASPEEAKAAAANASVKAGLAAATVEIVGTIGIKGEETR